MNRHERLEKLLHTAFPSAAFHLFDDSVEHAGHAGAHGGARAAAAKDGISAAADGHDGETHYRLHITDESFRGLPVIQIHRKILAAVKPETEAGMHSFVIEKAAPPTQPPPLVRGEVPKAEGGRLS